MGVLRGRQEVLEIWGVRKIALPFLFIYIAVVNNGRKYNKGVVVNNILRKIMTQL